MKNRKIPETTSQPRRDVLAVARRLHTDGNLDAAEKHYRKILRKRPRHPEALHLLGLIANQRGENQTALDLMQQSVRIKSDEPYYYNNLGLVLNALGRYEEAGECYRKALGLDEQLPYVHANLAAAMHRQGRLDDAIDHYEQALRLQPDFAEADRLIGDILREQKRYEQAIDRYEQAIRKQPALAAACTGTGHALLARHRHTDAVASFRKAVDIDPDCAEARFGLALGSQYENNPGQAIAAYQAAIRLAPENRTILQSYADYLRNTHVSRHDEALERDIIQILGTDGIEPQGIVRCAIALLRYQPDIQPLLQLTESERPDLKLATLSLEQIIEPLSHPMLLLLLTRTLLTSPEFERLLTPVRRELLSRAVHDPDSINRSAGALQFLCVLAQQCFTNDYVYYVTDDERREVERIGGEIENLLRTSTRIPAIQIALLASYVPLHRQLVESALQPAELSRAPVEFQALIRRQLVEPAQEAAISGQLPSFTVITDDVSIAVRNQYEESPYPRWEQAPYQRPGPLGNYIRQSLPLIQGHIVENPSRPEVLIAGCGTGRHAIMTAQRIARSRVLAIDLSRASLAYASRKVEELGVTNIQFMQADILKLAEMDCRFDLVECGGVLHHLRDPLAGWRSLMAVLKPGGFMRVALYSELARQEVVEAQNIIRQGGYATTHDEIRRFRRDLYNLPATQPARQVITLFRDFYNTAECRDLLFHVQEHRITLPVLRDVLDKLGLEFQGFEIPNPGTLTAYRSCFPDDPDARSFENWDQFEHDNPHTFLSMYVFWVRKP